MENKRHITLSYISVTDTKMFLDNDLVFLKVLEGSIVIKKNNAPQILIKNDIVAIHRKTCFLLSPTTGHNLVTFLRLDTKLCSTYEKGVGVRVYSANSSLHEAKHPDLYKELRHLLESITRIEIFENKKALNEQLKQLFALLINHFNFVNCGRLHVKFSEKMINRYSEMYKTYFRLSDKSSLKEISEAVGINYDHLRKDIKNRFGYSYHQLKDNRRVNIAVKYLVETELTITEICMRTGFSDHKYMVARFKNRFDMTPSELRKISNNDTKAYMTYMKSL